MEAEDAMKIPAAIAAMRIALSNGTCYGQLIVDTLRQNIEHINTRSDGKNEETSLHWASRNRDVDTVEWLLANGANTGLEDRNGNTAWDVAMKNLQSMVAARASGRGMASIRVATAFVQHERTLSGRSADLIKIADQGREQFLSLEAAGHIESSTRWYLVRSLSLLHVLTVLPNVTEEEWLRRHRIMCIMLWSFDTQTIPESLLSFRKPCFDVRRTNISTEMGPSSEGVWCISMPYITGHQNDYILSRRERYSTFREQTGSKLDLVSTLDEYCKPVLGRILTDRNEDQIISKYKTWVDESQATRISVHGKSKLITVSQAWVWLCATTTIVALDQSGADSFKFPQLTHLESNNMGSDAEIRRVMLGTYLSDLIASQDHPESVGLPEHFLDVYENAIHLLSNRVYQYSRLTDETLRNTKHDSEHFDASDLSVGEEAKFYHNASDIRGELSMIRLVLSHQEDVWKKCMRNIFPDLWKDDNFVNPLAMNWFSIEKMKTLNAEVLQLREVAVTEFLKELPSDVDVDVTREELLCMPEERFLEELEKERFPAHLIPLKSRKVRRVKNQDRVRKYIIRMKKLREIVDKRWTLSREDRWRTIGRPQSLYTVWKGRISRLDEEAARIEASIKDVMELRARHVSMKEAHATAVMGAAVLGFTFITIIFTPLSFVVGLFALPIKEFQDHKVASSNSTEPTNDKDDYYTTNYIGKYFATTEIVSIFVTVLAMLTAVQYGLHLDIRKNLISWLNSKRAKPDNISWYEKKHKHQKRKARVIRSFMFEVIYQVLRILFEKYQLLRTSLFKDVNNNAGTRGNDESKQEPIDDEKEPKDTETQEQPRNMNRASKKSSKWREIVTELLCPKHTAPADEETGAEVSPSPYFLGDGPPAGHHDLVISSTPK